MSKQMCKLVKDKFHVKKTKQFGKLVDKPGYVCKGCGRVANNKSHLCKPIELG